MATTKYSPETQRVDISDPQEDVSRLLQRLGETNVRLLLEKDGVPVASLISTADLKRLAYLEAERERDFAIFHEIGEAFKDVPLEEHEHEIAKAISEVREEIGAERRAKLKA